MSRVCVFCGSQPGSDRRFVDAATELGRGLALAGHTLVYGGSKSGCMGALADAALVNRGTVLGVIPRVLHASELRHDALTETVIVEDLAARKLEKLSRMLRKLEFWSRLTTVPLARTTKMLRSSAPLVGPPARRR